MHGVALSYPGKLIRPSQFFFVFLRLKHFCVTLFMQLLFIQIDKQIDYMDERIKSKLSVH